MRQASARAYAATLIHRDDFRRHQGLADAATCGYGHTIGS